MHNVTLAGEVLWKVALVGLVLGAGLPALFAVGVRGLALGTAAGGTATPRSAHPAGRVLAVACFGLVLAFVVAGLFVIIASGYGREVSFAHVYPTLVEKS